MTSTKLPPRLADAEIEVAQDILLLLGLRVTKREVLSWSNKKRNSILDWASACYLYASDNNVKVPKRPKFLSKEIIV